MSAVALDVANTRFILPPDAKVLPVSELSARARSRIGAQAEGQSVVTRQGFRVATRLIPPPLAALLGEFREPSLLTEAVLRFSQAQGEDPQSLLDVAFDALATLVEARLLVPEDAPEADAPGPSLAAGQEFAGFEIESSVRSLDDSEVFRARAADGQTVAVKIARDERWDLHAVLAHEAQMLRRLDGRDTPRLHAHGVHAGRAFLAMEWCSGVSIGVAAQTLRAARDRPRLHALVTRMLHAYGRLHASGVLHGDIHPGNCLVRDDGRVVILDFGHARVIADAASDTDVTRTGVPQFHDPQMARALLDGRPAPAATPASEQFAVAVLAYLLLTGQHPIDAPAVQDELLRRIAERAPLPFAARGVPAWPGVEQVLHRALAREPRQRFADVDEMAHAFARSDATGLRWRPSSPPLDASEQAFATAVEGVRGLEPVQRFRRDQAWFALRVALALDDAELLAAADLLATRASRGWDTCVVSATLAQARSDARAEGRAITKFLAGTDDVGDGLHLALLAASRVLDGASARCTEVAALTEWSAGWLEHLPPAEPHPAFGRSLADPSYVLATLALARTGRVPMPAALAPSLEILARERRGGVQLWALAHDVFADERYCSLALSARLPKSWLMRGFALLRRYQLTGERRFLVAARRAAGAAAESGLPDAATALLVAELHMPETASPPPFQSFFGVPLRWAPTLRR